MSRKVCQSCSMPMSMDPDGGGTEKDGTLSEEYCSYCYKNGEFVDDFETPEEMIGLVKEKLAEQGIGKFRQWLFTLGIKKLKRWKN